MGIQSLLEVKSKPKGWRAVTVDGQKYYWITSWLPQVIVRNAKTGLRMEFSYTDLQNVYQVIGPGPWDDWHECNIILPSHIAHLIKDRHNWVPEKKKI